MGTAKELTNLLDLQIANCDDLIDKQKDVIRDSLKVLLAKEWQKKKDNYWDFLDETKAAIATPIVRSANVSNIKYMFSSVKDLEIIDDYDIKEYISRNILKSI